MLTWISTVALDRCRDSQSRAGPSASTAIPYKAPGSTTHPGRPQGRAAPKRHPSRPHARPHGRGCRDSDAAEGRDTMPTSPSRPSRRPRDATGQGRGDVGRFRLSGACPFSLFLSVPSSISLSLSLSLSLFLSRLRQHSRGLSPQARPPPPPPSLSVPPLSHPGPLPLTRGDGRRMPGSCPLVSLSLSLSLSLSVAPSAHIGPSLPPQRTAGAPASEPTERSGHRTFRSQRRPDGSDLPARAGNGAGAPTRRPSDDSDSPGPGWLGLERLAAAAALPPRHGRPFETTHTRTHARTRTHTHARAHTHNTPQRPLPPCLLAPHGRPVKTAFAVFEAAIRRLTGPTLSLYLSLSLSLSLSLLVVFVREAAMRRPTHGRTHESRARRAARARANAGTNARARACAHPADPTHTHPYRLARVW